MIVVTAATGNIGKALVQELLAKKEKVRAIARDPKKLKSLADAGAETLSADLTDAASMEGAFRGADAVFTLVPPKYDAPNLREYYHQLFDIYTKAIIGAEVKYVVNLSSVGAHLSDHNGPIKGLYDNERRLNAIQGINVLHLRPAYFMENLFFNLGLIKTKGINGSPIKPDLSMAMIATTDIARFAADRLAKRDFSGKTVQELQGQRDLTMDGVTSIIGQAIGKPGLAYVQFPYEEATKAMVGMGMSADAAANFVEMYKGFNEKTIRPTQPRGPASTTPTSIEEFAKVFAAVYQNT